jgi:hypothetical protein
MKKPQKAKMNKMADNLIKRALSSQVKIMHREARTGDADLVKLYATDLADIFCICHDIKNGNFIDAYNAWDDLDTDVRDMFPNTLIDMLVDAEDWEYETNKEEE